MSARVSIAKNSLHRTSRAIVSGPFQSAFTFDFCSPHEQLVALLFSLHSMWLLAVGPSPLLSSPLLPSKYSYLAVSGVQVQCTIVCDGRSECPSPPLRSAAQIERIDVDGRTDADGGPRALLGSRRRWNVLLKFCGAMEQNEVIYCMAWYVSDVPMEC